jgi:FixJ family two-component response regulator
MDALSILLVDDEPELRATLQEALAADAYHVRVAASAEEALELLDQERFAVVLTDFHMPGGLSGLDLVEALRARAPGVVCVIMTGHTTADLALQALQHGVYDFVSKPFRIEALCRVLDRALEHAALLRQVHAYQASLEGRLVDQVAASRALADGCLDLAERLARALAQPTLGACLDPFLELLEAWYQPAGLAFLAPLPGGGWQALPTRGTGTWPDAAHLPPGTGVLEWPGSHAEGFLLDLGSADQPLGRICLGFGEQVRFPGEQPLFPSWKILLEVALRTRLRP